MKLITAVSAGPGSIVDTSTKLTPAVIDGVRQGGFTGIARYVPLPGNSNASDIDAEELAGIVGAGLGLLLVQHVRFAGWNPAQHSGDADARTAVGVARAAGYAETSHLFLDLEGINGTAADTKEFAEDWARSVVAAGYSAGCYVGFQVPLDARQLYQLHAINSYWSDAGNRAVATRGFAIKQQAEVAIGGVKFDPDTLQVDGCNQTPIWTVGADAVG